MSRGNDRGGDYSVGRGKPPRQHRFQKGKSGNPAGRPRKTPAQGEVAASADDIVLNEAYRRITLNDGGKQVELPVFQAVTRSTALAALKGSPVAQKALLQLVSSIEAKRANDRAMLLERALELKFALQERRDFFVSAGHDEWEMPVHPTDIEITASGEARFFLALTDEERAARAVLLEAVAEAEAILRRGAIAVAEDGDDLLLEIGRKIAITTILRANDSLPPRLRSKVLDERSEHWSRAITRSLLQQDEDTR